MCLPKDVSAMAKLMENTDVNFFQSLLDENDNYEVTVFDGMRKWKKSLSPVAKASSVLICVQSSYRKAIKLLESITSQNMDH